MRARRKTVKFCRKCKSFFIGTVEHIVVCLDCGRILKEIGDVNKELLRRCRGCGKYWFCWDAEEECPGCGGVTEAVDLGRLRRERRRKRDGCRSK